MFSTQASFSQQVLDKLNKKTYMYCFKKKGCKEQFSFNDKVDDWVQATKKQLSKIKTGDDSSQRALQKKNSRKVKKRSDLLIRIVDHSEWE